MSQGTYETVEQGGVVRDQDGRMVMLTAPGTTLAVAAAVVGNTVAKASSGVLMRVLITATGSAALTIFDNATTNTGTVIGLVAASAPAGTIVVFQMPAVNGIAIAGSASNPGFTLTFV